MDNPVDFVDNEGDRRNKAITEALHRVRAARNNVMGVRAGTWPAGETADAVLGYTVVLLDAAAEWLDGEQ